MMTPPQRRKTLPFVAMETQNDVAMETQKAVAMAQNDVARETQNAVAKGTDMTKNDVLDNFPSVKLRNVGLTKTSVAMETPRDVAKRPKSLVAMETTHNGVPFRGHKDLNSESGFFEDENNNQVCFRVFWRGLRNSQAQMIPT